MRVVISASSVSAVLGCNRHRPKDEAVAELLSKHAPDLVGRPLAASERAHAVMTASETTAAAVAAAEAVAVAATAKRRIEADPALSREQKRVAIEHVRSVVFCRHGTLSEAPACDELSAGGAVLMRDNAFHELEICKIGDTSFVVVDRVDRIELHPDGSRTLLEVKNRMHGLFGRILRHEQIQLQVYLQLVERHDGELRSHPVVRNQRMWSDDLLPKLRVFCKELHSQFSS